MNKRLLIIGSFPNKNNYVYGGITQDCLAILQSKRFSKYKIFTFNTSISNPPPKIYIRTIFAFLRLIKFLYIILLNKFDASLLFLSNGSSALEKGFYSKLLKLKNIKTILLPRAGMLEKELVRNNLFQYIINKLISNNDYVFCQGKNMQKLFKEKLFYTSNISVLNNWSTSKKFIEVGEKKFNLIKNSYLQKRKPNLIFVGWLEKSKGIYEIFDMAKDLLNEGYEFNLFLIGDGKEYKSLQELILKNQPKLSHSIKLIGWVRNSELIKYYKSSDIFVLPSYIEGLPNALVEAMLCCVVPVVSNVGSISDYIIEGKNGLLVKPKSQKILKKQIKKLLDNKKLIDKLRINAFKSAKKFFDQDKNLNKIDSLLIKMLDVD